ncbi:MAG: peroxiredoxin [Rhodospirillaceae bacterium]|nr:MAG: peroxiredoxin [Rhodospirillaceae bacterium]
MTLKIGDKIPSATLFEMGEEGPERVSTEDLFGGKTIILFGLPGAFTPTCSEQHLPGYIVQHDQLLDKGIDEIVCFSVNDAFVMGAWGKAQEMDHKVRMIGDGSGILTNKMGLEMDRIEGGMGIRCQRFAMVVKDGIVQSLDIEAPGELEVSSAAAQLMKL